MVFLASEQCMCRGEELQRALSSGLFVPAAQLVKFLPHRRLDDGHRNFTAGEHTFERARRAAVFEATAGPLLRHGLRSFNERVLRRMRHDPGADGENIDTFLRPDTSDRNVNRVDELRRGAVVDADDCEAAANAGVYTEQFHDSY